MSLYRVYGELASGLSQILIAAIFTNDCSIREYYCECPKVYTRVNGLNFTQRVCTGHMES